MLKFIGRQRLTSIHNAASLARRSMATGDVYKIHPAIGIARLGNSTADDWYVEPTTIGGLPTEKPSGCQKLGPEVKKFKNEVGQVRKQASKFTIYKNNKELLIGDKDVKNIKWKVWVANKKPIWWNFAMLCGDLTLGPDNSYENWSKVDHPQKHRKVVVLRNKDVKSDSERQKLIINPGPREVELNSGNFSAKFDYDTSKYPNPSFPAEHALAGKLVEGIIIRDLGDMNMNHTKGETASLYVRGAHGNVCGDRTADFQSFAGADGWFDDTSDGPVECEITLKNDEVIRLNAYVMCASPKFAPEIVNISNWDDVVLDMAVRYRAFGRKFKMVDPKTNKYILGEEGYHPHIETDIAPIFQRMKDYQWVANIAAMTQFATPPFDIRNKTPTDEEKQQRQVWFKLLRAAVDFSQPVNRNLVGFHTHQQIYSNGNDVDSYPSQPLNAGDGCVNVGIMDGVVSQFVTLTPTQYYFLYQWAHGITSKSTTTERSPFGFHPLDRATLGNCVGYPNSPGIETCWNNRNPNIYQEDDVYRLRTVPIDTLKQTGLSLLRDETASTEGCEPGDMSKRMAIPWQSDFAACTVQPVTFTTPFQNRIDPKYYSYWWPPQSPFNVYIGPYTADQAKLEADGSYGDVFNNGTPYTSGQNAFYQRGIQEIADTNTNARTMFAYWHELAFIANINEDLETRKNYPNFVEVERGLEAFKELKQQMQAVKNPDEYPVVRAPFAFPIRKTKAADQ